MFSSIKQQVLYILGSPRRFLILCLGMSFFTLVLDGSLWRLYSLHKQQQVLIDRTTDAIRGTDEYKLLIKKARDPEFLKKQAREKFDWIEEDELVFIFSQNAKR